MNYFNQNVCPYCNTKLHNFNTSNQNQKGYTCRKCHYTTWVNHTTIDENINDSYNIQSENDIMTNAKPFSKITKKEFKLIGIGMMIMFIIHELSKLF